MDKVELFFTQSADSVLALLHLFRHHPAHRHQTLCDGAAGFYEAFFGHLPDMKTHTEQF